MALATLAVAAAVIGALALRGRRSRALGEALAERDRLSEELARPLAELFSLREFTNLTPSSAQFDRLVAAVARYAMRLADAAGAAVVLSTEDRQTLKVAAAEGSLSHCHGRSLDAESGGLVLDAIARQQLQRANAQTADGVHLCGGMGVRSAIVAPLRAHGVPTGAIVVADQAAGAFEVRDERVLSTVAAHAAVVLANSRLFELIRRGKEQWEATFDALTEGIALVDGEGVIRRANTAFAALLGQPVRAVVGRHLSHALFGEPATLDALLGAARAGERPSPVVKRSQPLGRILRVVAAPVTEPVSDAASVAFVEDITEQKALEAQLIQSEKLAAVGTLVSGIAHELNNPLASIAGLSEFLLEQHSGSDTHREHLRVINDQAERASRIVGNLLTFARKDPSQRSPLDVADVVQRTVQLVSYEMRLRGVAVEVCVAPNLPPVMGNRDQLQQVVLNLLTNAVHALAATPQGRPRGVTVSLTAEGDRVVARVRDTGPGIPEEALPHVFDPFFTTKAPGEGTGLGLFISFGIAEAHGGTLTAESQPGQGATLVLALPVLAR